MAIVSRILAPLTTIALVAGAVLVPAVGATAADAKNATISGTVYGAAYAGEAQDPLAEEVTVSLTQWSASTKSWLVRASDVTDGSSRYEFTGLAAGTYGLVFGTTSTTAPWIPEFWRDVPFVDNGGVSPTKIAVTAGATIDANARLARGASISGVVHASEQAGGALANVEVEAYNVDTGVVSGNTATQVDDDGFTLRRLAAGTYKLHFAPTDKFHVGEWWEDAATLAAATEVTVVTGQEIVGLEATVALGGEIAGTVTKSTGGGISVGVRAYNTAGDVVATTTSNSAGAYSFPGLAAGDYRVGYSTKASGTKIIPEFSNNRATLALADTVVVAEGETRAVNASVFVAKKFLVTPKPKITGSLVVGKKLTAKPGEWKPTGATLSYAWKVDGAVVGTSATYTIKPADAGFAITLAVTANKTSYSPVTTTTKSTKKVAKGTMTSVVPKLSGTAKVGATLTVAPGAWKPSATTLGYKWLRNGKAISGQSGSSYLLTALDKGTKITVKVTGTATGYTSANATSKPKTILPGTLAAPSVPVVTGTAKVAETLTATSGAWATPGTVVTYQWKANGETIADATGFTYVVQGSFAGKKITFTATGKKAGYTTVTKTSVATAAVAKANLIPGAAPVLTGAENAVAGTVLSASVVGWEPQAILNLQWTRDGKPITGQTANTYKVTLSDRGHTIAVVLTATRMGYVTLTAPSAASRTLAPVTVVVNSGPTDALEGDGYLIEAYETNPYTVTVAGGEVFVFQAEPGFFDYAEVEADVAWARDSDGDSKVIASKVSSDGSKVTVTVPSGTTLTTMKNRKKAGFEVGIQVIMMGDDRDFVEIVGVTTYLDL